MRVGGSGRPRRAENVGLQDPRLRGDCVQRTGPYAMLCRLCTEEAREKARRARQNVNAPIAEEAQVKPAASFARHAETLVDLGQSLDDALAAYHPARRALEDATLAWREAIARPPGAVTSGKPDAAAANRLLTNGVSTGRHGRRPGRHLNPRNTCS